MFQILVVDDDKNTRRLLRAVLESEHYTVFTASGGEEALAVMDREQPAEHERHQGRGLLHDLLREGRAGLIKALGQPRIVHETGLVDCFLSLERIENLMAVDLHLVDLALFRCGHKCAVIDFLYTALYKRRKNKQVKSQQQYKYGRVKDNERFFRTFDFVQDSLPFFVDSQNTCASLKSGLLFCYDT